MNACQANTPRPDPRTAPESPWIHWNELPAQKLEQILSRVKALPRPPNAIQDLISEAFIERASSIELGKLVQGEPVVAAKILARVNSPFYRLRHPVANIGQAITFLGINQVRGICIQTMLSNSFVCNDPQTRQALDIAWRTNAAATLLLPRLAQIFGFTDLPGLTSKIILADIGQLFAATLLPSVALKQWAFADRTTRYQIEQQNIGLNAPELTNLMLRTWGIPDALSQDILTMERLLVALPEKVDPTLMGAATGYASLWTGDQLVRKLNGAGDPDWTPLNRSLPELLVWHQLMSSLGIQWDEHQLTDEAAWLLYDAARDSQTIH